jgi:HEAT repeat protein
MDIEGMKKNRDIRGLIRLLDHGKMTFSGVLQTHWAILGENGLRPLLKVLGFPKIHVRIGVIEALGEIKCPRSVEPLIHSLLTDESSEVRWVAALALGEIGDVRAIPPLLASLKDKDRYLRFGSAKSLKQLGWSPQTDQEWAAYYLAFTRLG